LDKILPYRLGLLCEKAPAVNFANISEKYMAMLGPTYLFESTVQIVGID